MDVITYLKMKKQKRIEKWKTFFMQVYEFDEELSDIVCVLSEIFMGFVLFLDELKKKKR